MRGATCHSTPPSSSSSLLTSADSSSFTSSSSSHHPLIFLSSPFLVFFPFSLFLSSSSIFLSSFITTYLTPSPSFSFYYLSPPLLFLSYLTGFCLLQYLTSSFTSTSSSLPHPFQLICLPTPKTLLLLFFDYLAHFPLLVLLSSFFSSSDI